MSAETNNPSQIYIEKVYSSPYAEGGRFTVREPAPAPPIDEWEAHARNTARQAELGAAGLRGVNINFDDHYTSPESSD